MKKIVVLLIIHKLVKGYNHMIIQRLKYLKLIVFQILSCLALTELAHGSDLKRLRTTATYDPASQQFIIHTPDYLAAKCWVGNLGMSNT